MANYIRTNEKTPNGGAYSEMYFLDANGNVVDEKIATHCVIKECTSDGELIRETWGTFPRIRGDDPACRYADHR